MCSTLALKFKSLILLLRCPQSQLGQVSQPLSYKVQKYRYTRLGVHLATEISVERQDASRSVGDSLSLFLADHCLGTASLSYFHHQLQR